MSEPENPHDKKTVEINAVRAGDAKSGEATAGIGSAGASSAGSGSAGADAAGADAEPAATLQAQLSDPDKSAMQRYQLVTLGTTSKFQLFKFELITLLAAGLPGALGLVTRKFLYPKILGTVGRNVVFGKGITSKASTENSYR